MSQKARAYSEIRFGSIDTAGDAGPICPKCGKPATKKIYNSAKKTYIFKHTSFARGRFISEREKRTVYCEVAA